MQQGDNSLVFKPTTRPVANALIRSGAYRIAEGPEFFVWKSGIKAPVYTDCRVLAGDVGGSALVVQALTNAVRYYFPDVDYVVGLAEAGVVWSARVAGELGKPYSFVRKARKAHGTGAMVECSPRPGSTAVLIDDLMASGDTAVQAIKLLQSERDIVTTGVMTIVNWNMAEMRENFAKLGVAYRALVSYPQLLQAGVAEGLLTEAACNELLAFYKNPREHDWDVAALRRPDRRTEETA